MRVLVVDDEELICKAVERALTLHDFEVVSFSLPLEALQVAEQETFDVILLDVMMPQMDGVALCARLRECKHLEHTPIIMISARSEDDLIVQAMDKGADDYVVKPFKAGDLVTKLEILIKKAKEGNLPSRFYSQQILKNTDEDKGEDTIG